VTKGNPSLPALFQGLAPLRKHAVTCCHPQPCFIDIPIDYNLPMKWDRKNVIEVPAKVRPCDCPENREYFQFQNGSIRRQIGQGHSIAERRARRSARAMRRAFHCQSVAAYPCSTPDIVANLLSRDLSLRPCNP
jgi:hypothetical protein